MRNVRNFALVAAFMGIGFGPVQAAEFDHVDQALRAGQYENALAALKQVPTDSREDLYGVLLRQGEIALATGKAVLAEELFEKAGYQLPTSPEAQAGLVRALMAQGRFKEAQGEARRALREAPQHIVLSIAVAQLENRLGQDEAALKRLDNVRSALDPKAHTEASQLLIAQAEILLERGRTKEARQKLQTWLERHPDDAAALDWLGQAEYLLGNREEGSRLRATAAVRYHTQGEEVRAAAIQAWMTAMNLYRPAPPPPQPEVKQTAREKETRPAPKIESQPTPAIPPRAEAWREPRQLPEPRFEPIHIPKGARIATGSGFIIDGGERVVTNAHVIGKSKRVIVRNGLGQVRQAKVEVSREDDDLAILLLDNPYPAQWAIPRGRMEEPRPGRSCYVLGYPLAGTLGATWPALTSGLVSRTEGSHDGRIQITAALNKGNSGGPVVDDRGRLIGIVVAKLDVLKYAEKYGSLPEDVNFAIRPSLLSRILSELHQKIGDKPEELGKLDAEEVYDLMLPSVVLVVAHG